MNQRLDAIEKLLETVSDQTTKNARAIANLALTGNEHFADLKADSRRLEEKIDALPEKIDGTYAPLLNELSDRASNLEERVAVLERQ